MKFKTSPVKKEKKKNENKVKNNEKLFDLQHKVISKTPSQHIKVVQGISLSENEKKKKFKPNRRQRISRKNMIIASKERETCDKIMPKSLNTKLNDTNLKKDINKSKKRTSDNINGDIEPKNKKIKNSFSVVKSKPPMKISQNIIEKPTELKDVDSNKDAINNLEKENSKKKRKYKGKRKKKKKPTKGEDKTNVFVKSAEDFSSNWKHLQQILDEDKKSESNKITKKSKNKNVVKKMEKKCESSVSESKLVENKTANSEIWFDGVDPILLPELYNNNNNDNDSSKIATNDAEPKGLIAEPKIDIQGNATALVKKDSFSGLTKMVAMDCEMVGVGFDGRDSALARVSIVNHFGQLLYDKYVKAIEDVTDYRTFVSGIRPTDLVDGLNLTEVQKDVADILDGRILVGHALQNDLKCLFLSHPKNKRRDTARYKPFKKLVGGGTPSLKKLSEKLLNVNIQSGEHSSVQDAQAAMRIYTLHRKEWEKSVTERRNKTNKRIPKNDKVKTNKD